MKSILNIIALILLAFNIANAQEILGSGCTPSHERAEFSVDYYLTSSHIENERIKAGTNNISTAEISHLESPVECRKLNNLINSNLKLRSIDQNATKTKFYYQTNDFYYIFWEEIHKNILGGPKAIFIVVNKETEEIFICYI